ncbi:MAG TPA: NADH-quinone oxidoreductase subunit L [Gemmataceae bacterium]|nr:NADH-quinone oxidoreductase subunit L [Gemmataceae bacterium]
MSDFLADPLKFYGDHPGWLFATATLLPLASFLLILLASGAWALLRRYRDEQTWIEPLYNAFGGDKGGRTAAYVATAAIGLAFVFSLVGFLRFTFVDGDKDREREQREASVPQVREKMLEAHQDVVALERTQQATQAREPSEDRDAKLKELDAQLTAVRKHAIDAELDYDAEEMGLATIDARWDARWTGRLDWLQLHPSSDQTNDTQHGAILQLGFRIDSLAALMFVMVTLIATLIHVFSIGYMSDELRETVEDHQVHAAHGHLHRRGRFGRFFMYLSLFCFSMLNLVLADNLFQVFVSWELVGICSYLLVGFYFERKSASNAANKAFITNRIGDAGFIIGLLILWTYVGTFNFEDIFRTVRSPTHDAHGDLVLGGHFLRGELADAHTVHLAAPNAPIGPNTTAVLFPREQAGWEHTPDVHVEANPKPNEFHTMPYWMLVLAGLGVFLGCVGKSAQFPLQVWLPDAMEGPTPVSALIHAATMVAAGVYLVARVYPLFTPEALLVIAYTGGITLFLAATVAVVVTDIKKVLAYSTVSQLGYLMLALGVGGWTAGLFHLLTHAFFKALLFLCSGAVIFNCHHEQDMLKMGGLFPKMKITAITMLIGVLSISGVPGFSGWYSKDAILAQAFGFMYAHPEHMLLFVLPLVTAGITTFYMFRMWLMTFVGKPRDHHVYEHAKESPWVMAVPLMVLAFFSVCVAYGKEPWNPEESYLADHISQSQPDAVYADFGRLKDEVLWKSKALPSNEHSVRQLAADNHALAGNLALGIVVLGLIFAALLYGFRVLDPAESKEQFAGVHRFLTHKWYFDELYSALVVRPALVIAYWFRWFDLTVIDGIIHFVANATVRVSKWDGRFDNGVIDGLVNVIGRTIYGVGSGLRRMQTGQLRNYVLFLVLAAVGVFLLLTWWVTMALAG